jgi:hypothetical protein
MCDRGSGITNPVKPESGPQNQGLQGSERMHNYPYSRTAIMGRKTWRGPPNVIAGHIRDG